MAGLLKSFCSFGWILSMIEFLIELCYYDGVEVLFGDLCIDNGAFLAVTPSSIDSIDSEDLLVFIRILMSSRN